MPPSRRFLIERDPAQGGALFERVQRGHRLGKRAVPMPTDEERRGTQGACLYVCREGHVWGVFVVRDGEGGFRPLDPADVYCEDDPCGGLGDDDALGLKASGIRFWTMR